VPVQALIQAIAAVIQSPLDPIAFVVQSLFAALPALVET
jgi:hypothetical protein